MSEGRYYSIRLMPDGGEGEYRLSFSTQPGMSASIGELRMRDLDALASILADRENVAENASTITAAPRRPHSWEPCPHCHGAGSGCHCDIEYV